MATWMSIDPSCRYYCTAIIIRIWVQFWSCRPPFGHMCNIVVVSFRTANGDKPHVRECYYYSISLANTIARNNRQSFKNMSELVWILIRNQPSYVVKTVHKCMSLNTSETDRTGFFFQCASCYSAETLEYQQNLSVDYY